MRPGDTESHRHPPQPARLRVVPRLRRAVPPPGPVAALPLAARPRHPPSRRASAITHEILDSFRSRVTETVQDLPAATDPGHAIHTRRAPGIAASATSPAGTRRRRHPPPAGTGVAPSASSERPASPHSLSGGDRAPPTSASGGHRHRDVRDQPTVRLPHAETEVPRPAAPGCGCRPAVGVVRWCCRAVVLRARLRWCCDVRSACGVSCSSAGRRGRWPAAPTGRRRPGRPRPAPSARRRSAPCPATRRPASDPSGTRSSSTRGR